MTPKGNRVKNIQCVGRYDQVYGAEFAPGTLIDHIPWNIVALYPDKGLSINGLSNQMSELRWQIMQAL